MRKAASGVRIIAARHEHDAAEPVRASQPRSLHDEQSGDVVALPLRDSDSSELRGRDSNPDYLIQSQASYH
jgi:hypothetical protein